MKTKNLFKIIPLLFIFSLSSCFAQEHNHAAHKNSDSSNKRSFTLVNYQFESSRQWLPGTIVVYQGETVEIKLVNEAASGIHGFAIPAYNIQQNVEKGQEETVSFVADKTGLFEMKCHIHPAHVGGQLLVMEKPKK